MEVELDGVGLVVDSLLKRGRMDDAGIVKYLVEQIVSLDQTTSKERIKPTRIHCRTKNMRLKLLRGRQLLDLSAGFTFGLAHLVRPFFYISYLGSEGKQLILSIPISF